MKIVILVFAALMSGCAMTADLAADTVKSYCASTTEAERTVIRELFKARDSPHLLLIYCEK